MKRTKLDAAELCRDIEDRLVPRLQISLIERAVYSHLLRHTRLEGRSIWFSPIRRLARGARLSMGSAREAVRSLDRKGVLCIRERSKQGHCLEVRLPRQIDECKTSPPKAPPRHLETVDFYQDRRLREAIYRRDAWRCFYCRRRISNRKRAIDHVVPRSRPGSRRPALRFPNGYRNLVAACPGCNFHKEALPAADFLRKLYRDERLNARELQNRLAALKKLAQGKLKPVIRNQL